MTGPRYHGRTHLPGGTDPIPNLGGSFPLGYKYSSFGVTDFAGGPGSGDFTVENGVGLFEGDLYTGGGALDLPRAGDSHGQVAAVVGGGTPDAPTDPFSDPPTTLVGGLVIGQGSYAYIGGPGDIASDLTDGFFYAQSTWMIPGGAPSLLRGRVGSGTIWQMSAVPGYVLGDPIPSYNFDVEIAHNDGLTFFLDDGTLVTDVNPIAWDEGDLIKWYWHYFQGIQAAGD